MDRDRFLTFFAPLFLVLILATSHAFAAKEYYRYTNNKGVTVIDDQIPPALVPNGYDIITREGLLIRRVPRELTDEELRLRNTDEARAQFKADEERKMREWDESLLLRYSDTVDIEAARDRALRDLHIRVSILRSNRTSLKSQIEREQERAADLERRGLDVPPETANAIEQMRIEIEDIETSIEARREEVENVRQSYDRDIERFKTLQDRIELRRKYSTKQKN